MKMIYLFACRLKQYFLRNRLLFALFVLGGMLNSVAAAYCYGNLLPAVANRYSQDSIYREYLVRFDKMEGERLQGYELTGWTGAEPTPPRLEDVEAFSSHVLIDYCTIQASDRVCTYIGDRPFVALSGSTEFTDSYQVIVGSAAFESTDLTVGSKITIAGISFEVIGVVSAHGLRYFIPYETFRELGMTDTVINVSAVSARRHNPQNDPVMDLIQASFPYRTYSGGPNYHAVDASATELKLPGIVINAFVSFLAYVFLLRYLIDSMLDESIISMVVGASRMQMTVLIFWEATVLSVGANCAGLLLHWLLYKPLFEKINLSATLTYSLADYAVLCLVMLIFSLIITIPFALKYLKLSPIAARRERA